MIYEVEQPNFLDLLGFARPRPNNPDLLKGITLVGSGKGALALVLRHLKERGVIRNKLDEILVPDWLGYWVYNQIQPYAFPAKRLSDRTRAILVYHQYGFPQDMDKIMATAREKNLVVIEDCAHAVFSHYRGRRLGFIGDYSIFSFSKWAFCYALGGVRGNDEFEEFAKEAIGNTAFGLTMFKDSAKWFYEKSRHSKYANYLIQMSYALYGQALKPGAAAVRLLKAKLEAEINLRQKRYQEFRRATDSSGLCDRLEKDGVTPYVIPIRVRLDRQESVVSALAVAGIESGIYQFDANRNLLAPNYISTVWIPCHGGISENAFAQIIEIVKKNNE
ncbi:MAG: DegT/DnrJ/EryC1/StrS family aminotransferase [bacterium]|nr:DegT/DnrJ/EryC1/StrS family aminotransferase [bacterium]